MIKFKTKTEFPVRDKRDKVIGNFIIRLIVNSIHADINGVIANGFYYYINANSEEVTLDQFGKPITWENVAMAETQLTTFDNHNLKKAFEQRIIEFTFIQQQIEDGENYGTVYTDWERDEEYDELLRQGNAETLD